MRSILCFIAVLACSTVVAIPKSPSDNRIYASLELENGLKVIVVQDTKAKMAAAALQVSVGSYQDPIEHQGLAHLVEHALFLGTKKFPEPKEYHDFVNTHGGQHNAMTGPEFTQYYFHIEPANFNEALTQFSEFFKTPLFKSSLIEKEVKAVDAEYRLGLNSDLMRFAYVQKSLYNPMHPAYRFHVGNKDTLGAPADKLQEALRTFFDQYYHANNMSLVLVGPQSIEELKVMATTQFSSIVSKEKFQAQYPPLYTTKNKNISVEVKPLGQHHELMLSFPIDSQWEYYRDKPDMFVAELFNNPSKGSLYSKLQDQNLINGLGAYSSSTTKANYNFNLSFSLTDKGIANVPKLLAEVFDYITFLQSASLPNYLYQDLKSLSFVSFFLKESEPVEILASMLVASLSDYKLNDVLTHDYLLEDAVFPASEVAAILKKLNKNNYSSYLISPKAKVQQVEVFYQGGFSTAAIAETTEIMKHGDWAFSKENPYLPRYLTPSKLADVSQIPKRVLEKENLRIWHMQDSTFNKPFRDVIVLMRSPLTTASPKNSALAALYVALVQESLNEVSYAASIANAQFVLSRNKEGLSLALHGFSDRNEKILKDLIAKLRAPQSTEERFTSIKKRYSESLENFNIASPVSQGMQHLRNLLIEPAWTHERLIDALSTIAYDDYLEFETALIQSFSLEALMHGDISTNQALALGELLLPMVKVVPGIEDLNPKIVKLPIEENAWQFASSHDDHTLIQFIQGEDDTVQSLAINMLTAKLLQAEFFDQLRNQEQLGYALGVNFEQYNRSHGLLFWLQSPDLTETKQQARIKRFIKDGYQTLSKMSHAEFNSVKKGVLAQVTRPPKELSTKTAKLWRDIQLKSYDFDYDSKLAMALDAIDLNTVLQSYADNMLSDGARVLVVHTGELNNIHKIKSIDGFKKGKDYFVN